MASFTNTPLSTPYNFFTEYSRSDIEYVKRQQDEEQQRRIVDTDGEKLKQGNALRVSEMFSLNVRPTWFQKGSSYALRVIKVARDAGNNILRSSQVRAINAKLQVAGQKSVATAQEMKSKIAVAGSKAQDASLETAHDVKEKLTVAQGVVSEKLTSAQEVMSGKLSSAQEVMSEKLSSAQEVAGKGIEKIQVAAKKFKRMSLKLAGRVNKAFSGLTLNTNLAFAVMEEENERAWRMNNEWETYAMLNAFKASSLIKELAPAFYRPAWEPNTLYATKLLENSERSRRILCDLSDRTAVNNAKAVSQLVEQKFRATTLPTPALVAAKAEVVEEIKVHKPIGATM